MFPVPPELKTVDLAHANKYRKYRSVSLISVINQCYHGRYEEIIYLFWKLRSDGLGLMNAGLSHGLLNTGLSLGLVNAGLSLGLVSTGLGLVNTGLSLLNTGLSLGLLNAGLGLVNN